jgi:hypothetical protein
MTPQYLEDWIDPDNHDAHRRFASESPANYIGCKTDCQSAYVLVPELNEAKAEVERLRSYEPCDPCKRGDHDDCTGNCMSMCCVLDASEKENERLLSVMQWMVSRKKLERQHVKDRCWGLSSDSLVLNVFDPSFALHEPLDPSDLMACARTVAMAPEHLQKPLRIILDRWIDVVCGKYPDSTGEIAQAISDVLSIGVGVTETATGQESRRRGTEQA